MTIEEYYSEVLAGQQDIFTLITVIAVLIAVIFMYLVFRDMFMRR